MDLKYNYVIIGADGYYMYGYHDVMDLPFVNYHKDYTDGFKTPLKKLLLRLNFSRVINQYIKTPFSFYIYPRLFPQNFKEKKPICFIFFGGQIHIYKSSYIRYLRNTYPTAKLVLYMQDIISSYRQVDFDVEKELSKFDLCLSYDLNDARKYNMMYYPTPMSYVSVQENPMIKESDIFFCGKAKTRYPFIHYLYRKLIRRGITCDFHILDMPKGAEHVDGIHYDNNYLTYKENIQHIIKTKAILEIMQDGAVGFTPRLWESIMYDKHLITNNESLLDSKYYMDGSIHMISDNLFFDDIKKLLSKKVKYSNQYKHCLSPLHLLQTIDDLI